MSEPTVLVIEDDPAVARALRRALKVRSVHCAVATCAKEVRATEGKYKLAIVDVNLPDGNGIDLYGELLSSNRVGEGIFFTATDDENDRARALELGRLIPKSDGVEAAVSMVLASLQKH
jgi:DNA-binding response OmpR family regulator